MICTQLQLTCSNPQSLDLLSANGSNDDREEVCIAPDTCPNNAAPCTQTYDGTLN